MAGILSRDLAFSVPEPALTNLWVVRVPFITGTVQLIAEKCTLPFPKIPAQARFNNGSNSYYPGLADIDGMTISFYETHDYQVSNWIKTWRELVKDVNGDYGLPAYYKKNIVAQLYSIPARGAISKTITYIGTWPTDKTPFEMSYEDETGRTVVDAQFSVDDYQETV